MDAWWEYDQLQSNEPYDWGPEASRGESSWDNLDFHVDLGCGARKKGRLGIDRFWAPGVDLLLDLEEMFPAAPRLHVPEPDSEAQKALERTYETFRAMDMEKDEHFFIEGLPFPDESIESIISHHALEHIGEGFIPLMDECHRILKPGGVMRIIAPLFPSTSAVEDPDHKRYFMEGSFEAFCGTREGDHWHESFSRPYTACRFEKVDLDVTARPENPADYWTEKDAREIRVALRKWA